MITPELIPIVYDDELDDDDDEEEDCIEDGLRGEDFTFDELLYDGVYEE